MLIRDRAHWLLHKFQEACDELRGRLVERLVRGKPHPHGIPGGDPWNPRGHDWGAGISTWGPNMRKQCGMRSILVLSPMLACE